MPVVVQFDIDDLPWIASGIRHGLRLSRFTLPFNSV
jgi:hypothetical protein